MRAYPQIVINFIAVLLYCGSTAFAAPTERFAQMVLPLAEKRSYQYDYNAQEQALAITIQKTAPQELTAVEHYDERLIRRVLVKDLGQGQGTELKLVLKDPDVRATITDFDEPFRIVIDLYDRQFQEIRDTNSGLPKVGGDAGPARENRLEKREEGAQFVKPLSQERPAEQVRQANQGGQSEQPRRLLQPLPEMISNSDDLTGNLEKLPGGPGKSWSDYPVYVYRIQTATYKTGKDYDQGAQQNTVKAMTSGEAMADYASKLFDYGHEGRALFAYQQVLHKAPGVFSQQPVHLWKLAEIHLGQGNLLLADGYYQSTLEKHPDSPLAKFAVMRRLDIKAIKAAREGRSEKWRPLVAELDAIKTSDNAELQTQIGIRRAYWSSKDNAVLARLAADRYALPPVTSENRTAMEQTYKKVENQWTAFLAATLLLNQELDKGGSWQPATTAFAGDYFEQYKGPKVEPFRVQLRDKIAQSLDKTIQNLVQQGKDVEAVQLHESLPVTLRQESVNPQTAWYLGEAFRHIGQPLRSISFYQVAARDSKVGPERFRAYFWLAAAAAQAYQSARSQTAQANALRDVMQAADQEMGRSWDSLQAPDRDKVFMTMKPNVEAAAMGKGFLKTPPRIVLAAWDKALGTEISATSAQPTDLQKNYSPTMQTVQLLSDLSRRFGELGMKEERARSLKLLMRIKPAKIEGGADSVQLWAKELTGLAEEYRQENNYLDSGRIYALIGAEADNWQGRAESLYKGGLLLYRAGRRAEAIEAFKKASEDPNNLMYADLAKTRLSQLQQ